MAKVRFVATQATATSLGSDLEQSSKSPRKGNPRIETIVDTLETIGGPFGRTAMNWIAVRPLTKRIQVPNRTRTPTQDLQRRARTAATFAGIHFAFSGGRLRACTPDRADRSRQFAWSADPTSVAQRSVCKSTREESVHTRGLGTDEAPEW